MERGGREALAAQMGFHAGDRFGVAASELYLLTVDERWTAVVAGAEGGFLRDAVKGDGVMGIDGDAGDVVKDGAGAPVESGGSGRRRQKHVENRDAVFGGEAECPAEVVDVQAVGPDKSDDQRAGLMLGHAEREAGGDGGADFKRVAEGKGLEIEGNIGGVAVGRGGGGSGGAWSPRVRTAGPVAAPRASRSIQATE